MREEARRRWLSRAGGSSEAWLCRGAVKLLRVQGGVLLETNVFLHVGPMHRSVYYALTGRDRLEIVSGLGRDGSMFSKALGPSGCLALRLYK
jgi:hypothetical protein